jgi:excisionase family DNA binding protein
MEHEAPEWLTFEAAANVLKVGIPTIESMVEQGVLAAQTRGGEQLISYAALVDFLKEDQRKLLDDDEDVTE